MDFQQAQQLFKKFMDTAQNPCGFFWLVSKPVQTASSPTAVLQK